MAISVLVDLPDLKELRKDLEAIELGLGREIGRIRRDAAEEIADAAGKLAPRGPGPISGAKHRDDALPHIGDTLRATAGGVGSEHPGAPVLEFGGTISPRGSPIAFEAAEFTGTAGRAEAPEVEAEMKRAIDRLMERHL